MEGCFCSTPLLCTIKELGTGGEALVRAHGGGAIEAILPPALPIHRGTILPQ